MQEQKLVIVVDRDNYSTAKIWGLKRLNRFCKCLSINDID